MHCAASPQLLQHVGVNTPEQCVCSTAVQKRAASRPHLPMQPRPNRVGSSEVKNTTSMGRRGWNPED